jgi:tetratricopeptide (TPR) repeat protein
MSLSVDQSIRKAKRYAKTGDVNQAAALYKAVLEKFPNNKRASQGLMVLSRPAQGQAAAGLVPPPDQMRALITLSDQGKLDAVIEQAAAMSRRFPKFFELYNILGVANSKLGRHEDAIANYKKAILVNPEFAGGHYNLGNAYRDLGRPEDAAACYARTIQIKPDFVDAHLNLGNIYKNLGRFEDAIANYAKALDLRPDYAHGHNNLGDALNDLGRYDEAIVKFIAALQIQPDLAEAHNNLGNAYKHLGRHEDAVASYEKAADIKPDYADAYNNLGAAFTDLGRREDAIASYSRALEIKPDFARAHRNLSTIKRYRSSDPQISQMSDLLAHAALPVNDQMNLNFGLGKANDDLGQYAQAYDYFSQGNRLRKSMLGYSISTDQELFCQIKSAFESENPVSGAPTTTRNPSGPTPVFIVGMPRSGTSLVEQVLASHSHVHGAGELKTLESGIKECGGLQSEFSAAQWEELGRYYRSGVEKLGASERCVTDKMPLNFRWIGFIRYALPEAKIIHVKRDARATCWSIFKHCFATDGNAYAYDMNDITAYYDLYRDMMDFWEEKFRGKIYHLNYEQLTENQEGETRNLLKQVGLEWQDQCLEFHKAERVVATASALQVREKIYTGSSQAWRKYEQFLELDPEIETHD